MIDINNPRDRPMGVEPLKDTRHLRSLPAVVLVDAAEVPGVGQLLAQIPVLEAADAVLATHQGLEEDPARRRCGPPTFDLHEEDTAPSHASQQPIPRIKRDSVGPGPELAV